MVFKGVGLTVSPKWRCLQPRAEHVPRGAGRSLMIPKGLPGVLEPLAKAGLGGVFSSNRLPILRQVLATLRIGALVSLLPALSEHLGACRVVLHLALHSKVTLHPTTAAQEKRQEQQRRAFGPHDCHPLEYRWGELLPARCEDCLARRGGGRRCSAAEGPWEALGRTRRTLRGATRAGALH
jgi:hypothetical protein